jgi:hypothetical protein
MPGQRQDGVRVHPRVFVVEEARVELDAAIVAVERKYDLTVSELFFIMAERMQYISGQCVREERKAKDLR